MGAKRIVILDDEENIGRSLRLILEHEGYAVAVFSNVADFRASSTGARADAYLLDVRLPDGSGIEELRRLKQNDLPAPVIMISGQATIADARRSHTRGRLRFSGKTRRPRQGAAHH